MRAIEALREAATALDAPEIMSASELLPDLSPREEQVLRLMSLRMTDPQIAAELGISVKTVSRHAQSIYRKLRVKSRREAAEAYRAAAEPEVAS
ncbi:MAG: helix-turn-helix transcriptional regulator [Chloroflexota bacterium]|nr:helix-turn-helix transcriptional regulator [Chloroflexota bacterium]